MGKQYAKFKLLATKVMEKLNWDVLYVYLEKEPTEMWERDIGPCVFCFSEYEALPLAQRWQKQAEQEAGLQLWARGSWGGRGFVTSAVLLHLLVLVTRSSFFSPSKFR